MGPDPAVAAIRLAVRRQSLEPGTVVVACSGGPDSLALLAATVFEARQGAWRVVGATVDHGLQAGSDEVAARVVEQMAALGAHETVSARVHVEQSGQGPEAAAREARYAVLEEIAERFGAAAVLLGHTLDDQAETVLLGLTRGSGGRSLAGMRPAFGVFRRPLLDITKEQTVQACIAAGIEPWADPHNLDARFTRSRVRNVVLPLLEKELGPGVSETLARTAGLLRDDMELLDRLAESALVEVRTDQGLDVTLLTGQPSAIRSRVLRLAAVEAGAATAELFHVHVRALVELVAEEGSGKQIRLPGHVTAFRDGVYLKFRATPVAG